ncbi:MAG: hypothetical protein AAB400_05335 [Patescibacteria group bacterium]
MLHLTQKTNSIPAVATACNRLMDRDGVKSLVLDRILWQRNKDQIYSHEPLDESTNVFRSLAKPLMFAEIFIYFKDSRRIRDVWQTMGHKSLELFQLIVKQIKEAANWVDPIASEVYGYDRRRSDIHAFGWDSRICRLQEDELEDAIFQLKEDLQFTPQERQTMLYRYRECGADLQKRFGTPIEVIRV